MPAFLTDLLNIFASLCKIRLYPQSLRIQAVLSLQTNQYYA